MRVCVRPCVRVCVRACVHASVCAFVFFLRCLPYKRRKFTAKEKLWIIFFRSYRQNNPDYGRCHFVVRHTTGCCVSSNYNRPLCQGASIDGPDGQ